MEYIEKNIKDGIRLHTINTDKFKTNLIAIFLTTKLDRKEITKNALISAVLRRGTNNMKTQEEISKKLEELYGASFDNGVDKTGDNQVLKFYIESINDNFLPHKGEKMLEKSIENIFDIVCNPLTENNAFKKEYVEQEKKNMKQRIEGRTDNKARYALDRCIEEMYKGSEFSLYKFGYVEDLEEINEINLYEQYKKLIKECKIDIFISGNLDANIQQIIENNNFIKKMNARNPQYNFKGEETTEKAGEIIEKMDVTQGKIVIGMNVNSGDVKGKYKALVYNNILGGSANSKLFQNVREKANLAYVASSSYFKFKDAIFINCGIEISNYEKALDVIKTQINDMKEGKFTQEDLKNAKKSIISVINTIDDEQDTGIAYCFGQEISGNKTTVEEYIRRVENVTMEDVLEIAKKVEINTIYFLRN